MEQLRTVRRAVKGAVLATGLFLVVGYGVGVPLEDGRTDSHGATRPADAGRWVRERLSARLGQPLTAEQKDALWREFGPELSKEAAHAVAEACERTGGKDDWCWLPAIAPDGQTLVGDRYEAFDARGGELDDYTRAYAQVLFAERVSLLGEIGAAFLSKTPGFGRSRGALTNPIDGFMKVAAKSKPPSKLPEAGDRFIGVRELPKELAGYGAVFQASVRLNQCQRGSEGKWGSAFIVGDNCDTILTAGHMRFKADGKGRNQCAPLEGRSGAEYSLPQGAGVFRDDLTLPVIKSGTMRCFSNYGLAQREGMSFARSTERDVALCRVINVPSLAACRT